MLVFKWFSVLALAVAAYAEGAASDEPKELIIETTYSPPECILKAEKGDKLHVHYAGRLFSNGNQFDSSYERGQPFPVTLGAGQVIRGWEEGLKGMCHKEKRTITIPAEMGYGSRGYGSTIPPNSALVFDVELVGLFGKGRDEL